MDSQPIAQLDHFTRAITIPTGDGHTLRTHQLAGAGGRFLAAAIDVTLQSITYAAIAWLILRYRPDLFPPATWPWAIPVGFIEWHIIYMMLFESITRGITPGKALIRLRVVTLTGAPPGSIAFVIRNVTRLADIALGAYLGSLALISATTTRQRLGDMAARTLVIYNQPLAHQLQRAHVPQSLYSTSEDGYLLEAWIARQPGLDNDSRISSAVDLAAYLHKKYDNTKSTETDPIAYLHQLYAEEAETPENQSDSTT